MYDEIFRLKEMLEKEKIPFDFHKFYDGYQIELNADVDVIQHSTSYGADDNLLEIMGALTEEENKQDDVLGYLTAEEVFKRFKYCHDNNSAVFKTEIRNIGDHRMREILFRGKRTDNGEWVEGCYAFYPSLDRHCIYIGEPCKKGTMDFGGKQFEVILETVGQYTGLTDKNGKKIFEGDIIKTAFGITRIVFDKCRGFGGYSDQKRKDGSFIYLQGIDLAFGKIYGNIHDNPVL